MMIRTMRTKDESDNDIDVEVEYNSVLTTKFKATMEKIYKIMKVDNSCK